MISPILQDISFYLQVIYLYFLKTDFHHFRNFQILICYQCLFLIVLFLLQCLLFLIQHLLILVMFSLNNLLFSLFILIYFLKQLQISKVNFVLNIPMLNQFNYQHQLFLVLVVQLQQVLLFLLFKPEQFSKTSQRLKIIFLYFFQLVHQFYHVVVQFLLIYLLIYFQNYLSLLLLILNFLIKFNFQLLKFQIFSISSLTFLPLHLNHHHSSLLVQ